MFLVCLVVFSQRLVNSITSVSGTCFLKLACWGMSESDNLCVILMWPGSYRKQKSCIINQFSEVNYLCVHKYLVSIRYCWKCSSANICASGFTYRKEVGRLLFFHNHQKSVYMQKSIKATEILTGVLVCSVLGKCNVKIGWNWIIGNEYIIHLGRW